MFTVDKSNIALRGMGYSSKTSFPSIFACLSCVGLSVHGMPVQVRGHLAGVSSFLQPRESWALNLGPQTWQQVSLLLTHIASQRNSFVKQKGAESYSVPRPSWRNRNKSRCASVIAMSGEVTKGLHNGKVCCGLGHSM